MYRTFLGLVFASCKTSIHHIPVNKGRFKSQPLLNEQALLACMTYVDLNPIRADLCDSLGTSDHTSVKQRIEQISNSSPETIVPLAPFIASSQTETGIPFSLADYLELTD